MQNSVQRMYRRARYCHFSMYKMKNVLLLKIPSIISAANCTSHNCREAPIENNQIQFYRDKH